MIPTEIYFTRQTPGGDNISIWIDAEEMELVIEAEGDMNRSSVFGPEREEYRIKLSRLLTMIGYYTENSFKFIKNQYHG